MNKLERLEEMEKQLAALRAEVEQEQWGPKSGGWIINGGGVIAQSFYVQSSCLKDKYTRDGATRETQEAAQKAAKEITSFKRLLAYRDEFAPDYTFEFYTDNFFITQMPCGTYTLGEDSLHCDISKLYMPENVAIELCRKLNACEVIL